MTDQERFFEETATAGPEHTGLRLDRFAALAFPDYSRSFLQRAIRDGQVTLNGEKAKPSAPVAEGNCVVARLPALDGGRLEPERMALDVLFEDGDLIVLNKPANLVTHPARGNARGTLANGLLFHCRSLSDANGPLRPGIVHRLDRNTTGVMVAAKTNAAHAGLAAQFHDRATEKHYVALVRGRMEFDEGEVSLAIGRDPRMREKMAVRPLDGRPALSRYRVMERFSRFTWVRVRLHTGRTHQVRVHMSALKHPVVADAMYGGGEGLWLAEIEGRKPAADEKPLIERQALHAEELAFVHPVTGAGMRFTAPLPEDLQRALAALRGAGG